MGSDRPTHIYLDFQVEHDAGAAIADRFHLTPQRLRFPRHKGLVGKPSWSADPSPLDHRLIRHNCPSGSKFGSTLGVEPDNPLPDLGPGVLLQFALGVGRPTTKIPEYPVETVLRHDVAKILPQNNNKRDKKHYNIITTNLPLPAASENQRLPTSWCQLCVEHPRSNSAGMRTHGRVSIRYICLVPLLVKKDFKQVKQ